MRKGLITGFSNFGRSYPHELADFIIDACNENIDDTCPLDIFVFGVSYRIYLWKTPDHHLLDDCLSVHHRS